MLNNGTELGTSVDGGLYKTATPALAPIAWTNGNSASNTVDDVEQTQVVGLKMPNAWGLYDMIGNVGEYCLDIFYEDVASLPTVDPIGPTLSGSGYQSATREYVNRGGGYSTYARNCRSAARSKWRCDWDPPEIGFRVCCGAEIK